MCIFSFIQFFYRQSKLLLVTKSASMDQEQHLFYDEELNFFDQDSFNFDRGIQNSELFLAHSKSANKIEEENKSQKLEGVNTEIKNAWAYNSMEIMKNMSEEKQNEYQYMFNNYKRFNGLEHLFLEAAEQKHSQEFLQNIESDALGNLSISSFEIDKLFQNKSEQSNLNQDHLNTLTHLKKHIQSINHKSLSSIMINKTVGTSFYEHFSNFYSTFSAESFCKQFEGHLRQMIMTASKIRGPGIDLISVLYDFWMKQFKEFIHKIWKCNKNFTLNFLKKEKQDILQESQYEAKSESSNQTGDKDKDKRKVWREQQIDILDQMISSSVIFTQPVLRKLASQFNRSVNSVSSKIQKLMKLRKGQVIQQESLLKKAVQILKIYSQGLNRETIIEKINENYQMGYGGQWEKSIGQLLSNRRQFVKLRGKYKLLNAQTYKKFNHLDDKAKLTFKDKVVQCFLLCGGQADMKTLVDIFVSQFEDDSNEIMNEERRKSVESNISKTLSRYDIFDSSCAKTIYLLNPLYNKTEPRNMELQVEQYFEL